MNCNKWPLQPLSSHGAHLFLMFYSLYMTFITNILYGAYNILCHSIQHYTKSTIALHGQTTFRIFTIAKFDYKCVSPLGYVWKYI